MTSESAQFIDLTYYGSDQRVFVCPTGKSWAHGQGREPLRELTSPDPAMTFNWGYTGSGANQVSRAILGDALGITVSLPMYQAFTADFVAQFPAEFRLRQGAVLRWVRGYLCDRGRHDFPEQIPPVDPHDAAYRPGRFRQPDDPAGT